MPSSMFDGSAKVLRHLETLAVYQRGELTPPVTVELDITNVCQHRCPRCVGGRTKYSQLSVDVILDLLQQLAQYGVKGVVFTGGGEPLCHPEAASCMTMAQQLGLQVGLITNGMELAQSNTLATEIVPVCHWIRISIDAGDPLTYRDVHGVDRFDDAWAAVAALSDAARCAKAPTIGVGYLIGEHTISGMCEAAALARKTGAAYIQFRPFIEEATSNFDLRDILEACRSLETGTFHVGYLDSKYHGQRRVARDYDTCHGCYLTAVVQADGNVPLCCLYRGQSEWCGGSIYSQVFAEIWEGERLRELRRIDPATCPPLCRHDTLNETVDAMLRPKDHENFL